MAKKNEIYKCEKSGLMVEVLLDAEGTPMCCGEPMKLLRENTTVGSVEHPMTDAHYIQWIELVTPTGVLRHNLTPQDKPVAEFKTDATEVEAREYCNLHGLWKG